MNILTFDIEEWFHILDNESTKSIDDWGRYPSRIHKNMDRIFEILDLNNQKATFFCLGWIAEKYPEIIRKIDQNGHEVATHSYAHQLVYEQTPADFKEDLLRSITILENITAKQVVAYRAPGFSMTKGNQWALDALIEAGIEIDCSIFPAARSHGGFADFGNAEPTLLRCKSGTLKEFPINLYNFLGCSIVFSGGGYFRLLPYPLVKYFSKKSSYIMTYFHPRDFDASQPIISELSLFRKFKSYYGLLGAAGKLDKMLNDFEFVDLKTAVKAVDWNRANNIDVC